MQTAHNPKHNACNRLFIQGFDQRHHSAEEGRNGNATENDALTAECPAAASEPERAAKSQQRAEQRAAYAEKVAKMAAELDAETVKVDVEETAEATDAAE